MSSIFVSDPKARRCFLYSPFAPEECAKRLRENMDSGLSPLGKRDIVGRVTPSLLKARVRIRGEHGYSIMMFAALSKDGSGTFFACRFGAPLYLKIIWPLWLIAALTLAAFLNIHALAILFGPKFAGATTKEPVTLIFSILFVIITAANTVQIFSINASQRSRLMAFVCNTVNAVERISPIVS